MRNSEKPSGGADRHDEHNEGPAKTVAKVLAVAAAARTFVGAIREALSEPTPAHERATAPLQLPASREPDRPQTAAEPRPAARSLWNPKELWALLKDAGSEWLEDKAPRMGAALAYYAVFSLAPLLVIVTAVAGLVFGPQAAQGQLSGQIQGLVGPEGAKALETMVASANKPATGTLASVLGVIMLLVGATGLFGELQDALNTVWEVQPKPGRGLLGIVRDRFLSFTMVLGTTFLLLVSLVVSAALAALMSLFGDWTTGLVGQAVNLAVSFGVITVLFAMIYRYLPDAKIAWRDVWFGAAVTSALFAVGKSLIGLYLGATGASSAYGAVGSLAVLLIWLYYSTQIFLFGAELTKAYANRYGGRIVPKPNAVPLTDEARAEQGIPRTAGAGA